MYILHSRKTKLSLRVYAAIVSYIMYVYIYICYSPMYIYIYVGIVLYLVLYN